MTSTIETSAISNARNPASISRMLPGTGDAATVFSPAAPPVRRHGSFVTARPMVSISAAACENVMPGFVRPPAITWSHMGALPGRTTPDIAVGTHTSGVSTPVPANAAGATPTTANGCPFNMMVWPTIDGSAWKRRVQKQWLNTITGLRPGCSLSLALKTRPAAGKMPNTEK